MNQQIDTQPSSLKQQDYEIDRMYTGDHRVLLADLKLDNLIEQNKINKEDINKSNQLNKDQTDQPLISKPLSIKKQKTIKKKSHFPQSLIDKISQVKLTKHDIIMLIINILMTSTLVLVYRYVRRSPQDRVVNVEEILVMKRGDAFGGPGGEEFLDDAETATLTFNDTITRVTATQTHDEIGQLVLLSLSFSYSNGKIGREYGGIGPPERWENLSPLELNFGEYIDQIIVYEGYRKIVNEWRKGKQTYIIIGIYLKTNRDQERLYGSNNGTENKESFNNYFLAYPQGKAKGFIDSIRFTWYKYCLKNSSIVE